MAREMRKCQIISAGVATDSSGLAISWRGEEQGALEVNPEGDRYQFWEPLVWTNRNSAFDRRAASLSPFRGKTSTHMTRNHLLRRCSISMKNPSIGDFCSVWKNTRTTCFSSNRCELLSFRRSRRGLQIRSKPLPVSAKEQAGTEPALVTTQALIRYRCENQRIAVQANIGA